MFPIRATSIPWWPRMAAVSAAVVLFPLVPVTATTRASAKSSSHRAMAVVTATPCDRACSNWGR
jgi:hypothetical protein